MELAIIIAQLLLRYGPTLTQEIAILLHSGTPPTLEQWQAIFKKCRSLDEYVDEARAAQLPIGPAPVFRTAGGTDSDSPAA